MSFFEEIFEYDKDLANAINKLKSCVGNSLGWGEFNKEDYSFLQRDFIDTLLHRFPKEVIKKIAEVSGKENCIINLDSGDFYLNMLKKTRTNKVLCFDNLSSITNLPKGYALLVIYEIKNPKITLGEIERWWEPYEEKYKDILITAMKSDKNCQTIIVFDKPIKNHLNLFENYMRLIKKENDRRGYFDKLF